MDRKEKFEKWLEWDTKRKIENMHEYQRIFYPEDVGKKCPCCGVAMGEKQEGEDWGPPGSLPMHY